jgi:excisionase family DNA binding protein
MNGTIQLIQISPDELQSKIVEGIKAELDSLKKEFQPRQPIEFMTRNEVRDLLQVNLSTVHNLTRRGELKCYAIGGSSRIYYKRHEVEQAIKPLNK